MSWPTCTDCGQPATCFGFYSKDIESGYHDPSYSCDDCCGHRNDTGWCEPVEATSENKKNDEPGSNPNDVLCACGCGGPALYTCYTGDGDGVASCALSMRALAEDAKLFGERFLAKPFPKPLAYSMVDHVNHMP